MGRKRGLPDGLTVRGNTYYATIRYGQHGERKRFRKAVGKVKDGLHTSTELLQAAKDELRHLQNHYAGVTAGEVGNGLRVEDLAADYLRWSEQHHRPNTHRDYTDGLDRVLPKLGAERVEDITVDRVMAYRKARLSEFKGTYGKDRLEDDEAEKLTVSPRTVNKDIDTLHHMLNWGARSDVRKIASNPIKGLEDLPTDDARKERRALTAEECEALLTGGDALYRPIWRCFLTTGMRACEVQAMRFQWVDFEAKEITVPKHVAKTHRNRRIPMSEELLADIKRLQAQATKRQTVEGVTAEHTEAQRRRLTRTHVFVTHANTPWDNNLLARFYSTCRQCGIETHGERGDVDLHSLRVTFATLALGNGANPRDVQEILGHSTLDMTMRIYAKATSRGRQRAVNSLPFATAARPEHVLSLDDGPKLATATENETQPEAEQDVG